MCKDSCGKGSKVMWGNNESFAELHKFGHAALSSAIFEFIEHRPKYKRRGGHAIYQSRH